MRADFRCLLLQGAERYGWEQEIEGSPFAKVPALVAVTESS